LPIRKAPLAGRERHQIVDTSPQAAPVWRVVVPKVHP
jgi:hypothetical protein